MRRYVMQFLFACFFGFTSMATLASAANADQIPDTSITDTNPTFSQSKQLPQPVKSSDIANNYQSTKPAVSITRATTKRANTEVNSGSYITIGGRSIAIFDSIGNTTVDAGSRVARYNDSFLFGHNTGIVFGHLAGLPTGTTFSVTINGQTTNYRISEKIIYKHEFVNGRELLYPEGMPGRNFMGSIVGARTPAGAQHSLAIMTCYGTSYGNGDASHRLVVFADRI